MHIDLPSSVSFPMVVAALLAGCGSSPSPTGTIPDQLEALEVALTNSLETPAILSGGLTVTGADRDFEITVSSGAAPTTFTVHSPATSPLGQLSGADAEVEITTGGYAGPSLFVADAAGPLYAGVFGTDADLADAEKHFGAGFARRGDEVGTQSDGAFIWSYRKAVFKTDDGDVAMLPGDVKTLRFAGAKFRAVVIASYTTGADPSANAQPSCITENMLSFELLRVAEAPAASEPRIVRPTSLEVAYAGCTAPNSGGE